MCESSTQFYSDDEDFLRSIDEAIFESDPEVAGNLGPSGLFEPRDTSSPTEDTGKRRRQANNSTITSFPSPKRTHLNMTTENENKFWVFVSSSKHPVDPLNCEQYGKILEYISAQRLVATYKNENVLSKLKIEDIDMNDDGVIIVKCMDKFTATWVKSLTYAGESLPKVRSSESMEEANRMGRCSILVKKRDKPYNESEFKLQIVEGNKEMGLVVKKIILWDRKLLPKDPKHMVLNFSADYDFIESLKSKGNLIYFDLKRTQIFYPGMERKEGNKRVKRDEI